MFPKPMMKVYRDSVVHPEHGPALAKAVVFIDPEPESFEWSALEWALSSGMSVFALSER